MPVDIATTATDDFAAAINAPAGGDPRTASSVSTPMQSLTNRTFWLWQRLKGVIGYFLPLLNQSPTAVTAVNTASDTLTVVGHGLSNNDPLRIFVVPGNGVMPAPLSASVLYYAIVVDANTLQLSLTSGPGAAVDLTTTGSGGTFYLAYVIDSADALFGPLDGVLPAGTLRTQLRYLRDNYGRLAGANAWTALNTFAVAVALNGATTIASTFTRTGTGPRDIWRYESIAAPGATFSLSSDNYDDHTFFEPTVNCTVTMSNGTVFGERVRVSGAVPFTSFSMVFKSNGGTVATFPVSADRAAVEFVWGGVAWFPTLWSGSAVV